MSEGQETSQTGDTGATNDKTTSKKTSCSGWCKKFWLIVGGLVFLVMAVALPLMTGTDFCLAHLRCSDHERPTLSWRASGVGTLSPGVGTSPRGAETTAAPRRAQVTPPATLITTAGPYGDAREPDCAAYKAAGYTTSGVYKLGSPLSGVTVYCDMDTDGQGGWTVIQRRLDGSVPFTKNWEEYKHGFGNKNGEYWLGNENIHRLTNRKNYRLRIELMDWDRETRYAEYNTFRVAGESDRYRLTISGYSGDAGDSMTNYYPNNGQMFSTVDRDNDAWEHGQCSQLNGQAGWWFENCSHSFLNGRYLGNCGNSCEAFEGVAWKTWKGKNYSLKSVSMKIRP
ncbi:PREDICTED: fibrinogen-like protein 1 [Branchiostoma belcheri]|uniref:Fibrinogen-like protein 1 n=1 Tax=Branchiostoma belcheri TaxID=7741 RepID=A0A6P5A1Q2_BRABE|nr:PREDICTED: fibrinogen-like protein 1 [Branchiostoma belcheri]